MRVLLVSLILSISSCSVLAYISDKANYTYYETEIEKIYGNGYFEINGPDAEIVIYQEIKGENNVLYR